MMEEMVPFGGSVYWATSGVLLFSRGMDFFSTWIATPNLVLEANPIARKLGWRFGVPLNVILCAVFGCWPLPALIIATTSLLVAARNFQMAWLMRLLGEDNYGAWFAHQIRQSSTGLYLLCLFAQGFLYAIVGGGLLLYSGMALVPVAVGVGIITYGAAVVIFTLLATWRVKRPQR